MSLVAAQLIVSSGGLESWSVELVSRFSDGDGRLVQDTRGRIGAAEASGAIAQLDGRILRIALGLLRGPRARHGRVQLNVSPRSLMHPGFAEEWIARIEVAGIEPGRLVLQVDADAVASRAGTRRPLDGLTRAGAALALDDVTAAPSVLRTLEELPVGQIRLRAEDIHRGAQGDPDTAAALLRASLAARLHGAQCLAQGVDTETHLAFARDIGCDLVQGELTGRATLMADHRQGRHGRAPRASRAGS